MPSDPTSSGRIGWTIPGSRARSNATQSRFSNAVLSKNPTTPTKPRDVTTIGCERVARQLVQKVVPRDKHQSCSPQPCLVTRNPANGIGSRRRDFLASAGRAISARPAELVLPFSSQKRGLRLFPPAPMCGRSGKLGAMALRRRPAPSTDPCRWLHLPPCRTRLTWCSLSSQMRPRSLQCHGANRLAAKAPNPPPPRG